MLTRDGYDEHVVQRLRGDNSLMLDPVALSLTLPLKYPLCPARVAALDTAPDTHWDSERVEIDNQTGFRC